MVSMALWPPLSLPLSSLFLSLWSGHIDGELPADVAVFFPPNFPMDVGQKEEREERKTISIKLCIITTTATVQTDRQVLLCQTCALF